MAALAIPTITARSQARAALAVAGRELRQMLRYPISTAGFVINPLYSFLIPSFLFGATFAVAGQAVGLEATAGTTDIGGFLFAGLIVAGLISAAFWSVAFGLRMEMDMGTLEPSWLTPTSRAALIAGRATSAAVLFAVSAAAMLGIGIVAFGLRIPPEAALALPALALAALSMAGIAYLITGAVLLMREANFFVDTTNFLVIGLSGVAFPITVLPGALQAISLVLPTTYALDLLRHYWLGTRTLMDPLAEHLVLVAFAIALLPLGRWAFARAERRMRVTGGLGQH